MLISKNTRYDYVLNLAALKHVRSAEDAITLMRLVQVNVLNVIKTIAIANQLNAKKYFAVSTDKATDPINLMGASKKIMELFLNREENSVTTSTARFANVGFSDGSLLFGFKQRLSKEQPLAVPKNIYRYFITDTEAGKLCLLSCILGTNNDLFIPAISKKLKPLELAAIAERFLHQNGFEAYYCSSEAEARQSMDALKVESKWPIFLSKPNTSGEKEVEKFYTESETVDYSRFEEIGVIRNDKQAETEKLDRFIDDINNLKMAEKWEKEDFVHIFKGLLPNFTLGRSNHTLNNRM
jgi:FlaA1/EpsC-like NDP-sugar epimerase